MSKFDEDHYKYLMFFHSTIRDMWIFGFTTPVEAIMQEYRTSGITNDIEKYSKKLLKEWSCDRSSEFLSDDEALQKCLEVYPSTHFFHRKFCSLLTLLFRDKK